MCDGGGDGGADAGANASDIGQAGRGGFESGTGKGGENSAESFGGIGFGGDVDIGLFDGTTGDPLAGFDEETNIELTSGIAPQSAAQALADLRSQMQAVKQAVDDGVMSKEEGIAKQSNATAKNGRNMGEVLGDLERGNVTDQEIGQAIAAQETADALSAGQDALGKALGRGFKGLFGGSGTDAPEGSRGSDTGLNSGGALGSEVAGEVGDTDFSSLFASGGAESGEIGLKRTHPVPQSGGISPITTLPRIVPGPTNSNTSLISTPITSALLAPSLLSNFSGAKNAIGNSIETASTLRDLIQK